MRITKAILFCASLIVMGSDALSQDRALDPTQRHIEALQQALAKYDHRRAEALLSRMIRSAPSTKAARLYVGLLHQNYRRKPLRFDAGFQMLPSTNLRRAASSSTFATDMGELDITDGGNARSGLGLSTGFGATYRFPIDTKRTLEFSGRVGRTYYKETELRYWSESLGVSLVRREPRKSVTYGMHYSRSRFDLDTHSPTDSADLRRLTFSANHTRNSAEMQRTFGARLEYRDYIEKDAKDGLFAQAKLGWATDIGIHGRLSWGIGVERHTPNITYQRSWGVSGYLGYSHTFSKTTRLSVHLSGMFRQYDENFAAVNFKRAEDIATVTFSATDVRLKVAGAVPTFSCSYSDNRSNIALYQTSYTDCAIRFSFDF